MIQSQLRMRGKEQIKDQIKKRVKELGFFQNETEVIQNQSWKALWSSIVSVYLIS